VTQVIPDAGVGTDTLLQIAASLLSTKRQWLGVRFSLKTELGIFCRLLPAVP
jgi:hypothetical protein